MVCGQPFRPVVQYVRGRRARASYVVVAASYLLLRSYVGTILGALQKNVTEGM